MTYRPRYLRRPTVSAASETSPPDLEDRDLGPLMRGYYCAAQEIRDQAVAAGKSEDEVIEALASVDLPRFARDQAPAVRRGLVRALPQLMIDLRNGERRIAQTLAAVWGPADQLYQAITISAFELGDWTGRDAPYGAKTHALRGLLARGTRTAGEVRALAMNGFRTGAEARWRSLHELAVVARVIGDADEEIAQRYISSSSLERLADAEAYQRYAERLKREPYTDDEMETWRAEAKAATDAFGVSLAQPNGWAEPLFPGRRSTRGVPFWRLEQLAELEHLRPFYRLGNHAIHAGARAAELNTVRLPSGVATTTGSSVYGDIAETSHGALISLFQIFSALIAHRIGETDSYLLELLIGQITMGWMIDEAGDRYEACARAAADRGLAG